MQTKRVFSLLIGEDERFPSGRGAVLRQSQDAVLWNKRKRQRQRKRYKHGEEEHLRFQRICPLIRKPFGIVIVSIITNKQTTALIAPFR